MRGSTRPSPLALGAIFAKLRREQGWDALMRATWDLPQRELLVKTDRARMANGWNERAMIGNAVLDLALRKPAATNLHPDEGDAAASSTGAKLAEMGGAKHGFGADPANFRDRARMCGPRSPRARACAVPARRCGGRAVAQRAAGRGSRRSPTAYRLLLWWTSTGFVKAACASYRAARHIGDMVCPTPLCTARRKFQRRGRRTSQRSTAGRSETRDLDLIVAYTKLSNGPGPSAFQRCAKACPL